MDSLYTSNEAVTRDFVQRWPDGPRQNAYLEWVRLWDGRIRRRLFEVERTVEDFIGLLKSTTFNNDDSVQELALKMSTANLSSIYLGSSSFGGKTEAYGISPGNAYLWPHLDMGTSGSQLLHRMVLGVNLNVPIHSIPRDIPTGNRRREQQRSSGEDSVESAESDDIDHSFGFTFVQIGALAVVNDREGLAAQIIDDEDFMDIDWEWSDTGFGVVVEVKPNAQLGAVWAIYGFHKLDFDDPPNYVHIPTHDIDGLPLHNIGRLYTNSTERFTVAKIAESIDDLTEPRHPFDFQVESRRECQLVRAKLVGIQRNVSREYIDRERLNVR